LHEPTGAKNEAPSRRARRILLALRVVLSPLWLPFWGLLRLLEAVAGTAHYVVVERSLEPLLGRPIRLSAGQLAVAHVPMVLVSPLFVAGHVVLGYVRFWFRFHKALGRWQTRSGSDLACLAAGLVFSWAGLLLFASIANGRWAPDDLLALFLGFLPEYGSVGLPFLPEHLTGWWLAAAFLLRWALLPILPFWYIFQACMLGPVLWYTFADYLAVRPLPAHLPLCPLWGVLVLAGVLWFVFPLVHRLVAMGPAWRWGLYAARVAAALLAARVAPSARPFDELVFVLVLGLVGLAGCMLVGWVISSRNVAVRQLQVFLSLRFLSQRRIAFFAVFAVTLCTAMVLIVVSVMGGFLDMVRERSRGLLGDLVMDNYSLQGFPYYQEFIDEELKKMQAADGRPLVVEATPVLYSYGVLRFLETSVTKPVRIVGIRLEETYRVNDFLNSLYYEKYYPGTTRLGRQKQPVWGWDEQLMPRLPDELEKALARAWTRLGSGQVPAEFERAKGMPFPGPGNYASPAYEFFAALHGFGERIVSVAEAIEQASVGPQRDALRQAVEHDLGVLARQGSELLRRARRPQWRSWRETLAGPMDACLSRLREAQDLFARGRVPETAGRLKDAQAALEPSMALLASLIEPGYFGPELPGLIIGREIIADRDESGRYTRHYARGEKVQLVVAPFTRGGALAGGQPLSLVMRYVDDSRTGVYEIDSMCVYGDFAYLQEMLGMGRIERADGSGFTPPRASQIQIRLRSGVDPWEARDAVQDRWDRFVQVRAEQADPIDARLLRYVRVETWEQKQRQFIAAVEKEKVLVTVLFGVISVVAIFLVLCIFYMIVIEKTRDIGIIKSIGGAPAGVAMIFLAYGAAIGVVGSAFGTLFGWLFVRDINRIQDWLASLNPNLRVWSREVYVFDYIPSTIKLTDVVVIVTAAILGCVLGAVIPAVRAARMRPVDALRYE